MAVKQIRVYRYLLALFAFLWSSGLLWGSVESTRSIIYVKSNATGRNNGTSWANAYTSLQSALNVVASGSQIWVARGTYIPSVDTGGNPNPADPRSKCFRMKQGVGIYGGFVGTETAISQRTSYGLGQANETTLSGDVGVAGVNTDNCVHIIYNCLGLTRTAVLDGFTIRDGYGKNSSIDDSIYGAGICGAGDSPTLNALNFVGNETGCEGSCIFTFGNGSPLITNCVFTQNTGCCVYGEENGIVTVSGCTFTNNGITENYGGAGIFTRNATQILSNCSFTGNWAYDGGAVAMENSTATITGCSFTGNHAILRGGAFFAYLSTLTITGSTFISNYCTDFSSGGGAVYMYNAINPTFSNCVVTDNAANYSGGGLDLEYTTGTVALTNCTLANNRANMMTELQLSQNSGGDPKYLVINNSIIWGDSDWQIGVENTDVTLNYSCYVQTAIGGDGSEFHLDNHNLTINPLFVDAANNDLRLIGYSGCINSGNNAYNTASTDIRGRTRIQNGTIDMGAYEFSPAVDPTGTKVFVKHDATGSNNGTSWANAYTSLQTALNAATRGTQIWVARGTYYPSYSYDLPSTPRYYHYRLKDGVGIFGGFGGDETSTDQRTNYGEGGANETILSGDIGVAGVNDDNCYHVIYNPASLGITGSTTLDGITITGGNANYNTSASNYMSYGGGICNDGASPYLKNVILTQNYGVFGGAMANINSSPYLVNSLIHSNTAVNGGGIYNSNYTSLLVTNATITDNTAVSNGGAFYNTDGGEVICNNGIIWGNEASVGQQSYSSGTSDTYMSLGYSCYAAGSNDNVTTGGSDFFYTGTCVFSDPCFVSPASHDYRLYGNSPAVNTGFNLCNSELKDLRGFTRVQNNSIDMGAYEWTAGTDPDLLAHINFLSGATFVPQVINGENCQVVAKFTLQPSDYTSVFNAARIKIEGEFSGLSNFQIWESADDIFNPAQDEMIAGGELSVASPARVAQDRRSQQRENVSILSFTGLARTLSLEGKTYFITCNIASEASGSFWAKLADMNDLTFTDGRLSAAISNALLANAAITLTPTIITTSVSYLPNFGQVTVGSSSSLQSYIVSAIGLQSDLTIDSPAGFMISLDPLAVDYVSQIVLTPTDGVVDSTTIYVKYCPFIALMNNGDIIHTSLRAQSRFVAVSGEGTIILPAPTHVRASMEWGNMVLRWDQVPGAVRYKIYASNTPNGDYEPVETVTTPMWVGYPVETKKFYRVTACTD